MRRNNKRALYEKIMRNISKEVKHILNEDANYYYVVSYEVYCGRRNNEPCQWFGPYREWELDEKKEIIRKGIADMIRRDGFAGPPDEGMWFFLSYKSEDELADILGYTPDYLANTSASIESLYENYGYKKYKLNENTDFSLDLFNKHIKEIKKGLNLPEDLKPYFMPSIHIGNNKVCAYFVMFSRDEDYDVDYNVINKDAYKSMIYDIYQYFVHKYKNDFDDIRPSIEYEQNIYKCYALINNDPGPAAENVYKFLKDYIQKVNDIYKDYELNKLEEKRRYNKRYKYLY